MIIHFKMADTYDDSNYMPSFNQVTVGFLEQAELLTTINGKTGFCNEGRRLEKPDFPK